MIRLRKLQQVLLRLVIRLFTAKTKEIDPVTDHILPLFKGIQPSRVTRASVVIGSARNQREYEDEPAQQIAEIVKTYSGDFTGSDRIQPWTWDFVSWIPRDHTPLVFMVTVLEEWTAWEYDDRRQMDRLVEFKYRTSLSCYDVQDRNVYDCRQWQGSIYYELGYHFNSVQIPRETVKNLTIELGI